ncbi:fumarylacetoacetate hydrolase family protein [Oceanisphaera avium]|uniref:Isomerase/hydrolase n=1 Tax=Oceanisphaera avium TaxID=1903694 RepID=A0A1Y0CVN3_9GAMM|nr:fumarylacetoacetate hydrolase family protein [Oceanisphaera avium]ART79278.1 isomerase/hydrolase [Oceanisphaera avium]
MYQHLDLKAQPLPYSIGKVVCVGRSYREHALELANPVPSQPLLFIKPASSLVNLAAPLILPKDQGVVHHEIEVALLLGHRLCKATPQQSLAAVVGVGLGLDLTLRDLQDELKLNGHPWERAKAFDDSCPMSPFVAVEDIGSLHELPFSLSVNNELRQTGNTQQLMWPLGQLLAKISHSFTLSPGDIVLTGTPKGVSALHAGDTLVLTLDGQHYFSARVAP